MKVSLILKRILSALSEPEEKILSSELLLTRQGELSPNQMVSTLRRLFGDSVSIIDPALSLQTSPLAPDPVQANGAILYLQALRQIAPPGPGRVLAQFTQPIVMLIAQPQKEEKARALGSLSSDEKIRRRATVILNAWKALVIVPKNYTPPEGKPVGNDQNPLIYYFDPQSTLPANQAPREVLTFCQVLTRGCQAPALDKGGRQVMVRAEPVFGPLGFFHGCRNICMETSDSAWWALYFAIMAVSRGGVNFQETDKLSLFRLQTVLGSVLNEPESLLTLPPVSSSSSVPTISEMKENPAEDSWLLSALQTVSTPVDSGIGLSFKTSG